MSAASEQGVRVRLQATGFEQPLVVVPDEPAQPGPGQVLVEVEACGVCHRDLLDRAGRFPFQRVPITPGHEAVGRVVALGENATRFAVGDRVGTMHRDACGVCGPCREGDTSLCQSAAWVFGILADGGYASSLVAPESALYPVPDEIPAAEAAVMHCTVGTTYRDLHRMGRLREGERVLVTGANGGMGAAAVEVAARLGAEVIAVVRNARHEAFLKELGAERVVVNDGSGIHKQVSDVDLAYDSVGTPTFNSALRCLRVGGRLITVGNIVPERASLNLGLLITRGLSIIGGLGATPSDMAELLALHQAKPFRMPIARTFPLEEAEAAQALVRAGGLEGRVVLVAGQGANG